MEAARLLGLRACRQGRRSQHESGGSESDRELAGEVTYELAHASLLFVVAIIIIKTERDNTTTMWSWYSRPRRPGLFCGPKRRSTDR
jgi:hypothetical protein